MGSRRELLASLAFVGAVVLGFQAIDPLRDQSAGGATASCACWMPVVKNSLALQSASQHGPMQVIEQLDKGSARYLYLQTRRRMGRAACRASSTQRRASSCAD